MKKIAIVAGIALVGFASCKKDYNCRCSATVLGVPAADTVISLGKETKKNAKSKCEDQQTAFQSELAAALTATGLSSSLATVSCDIEKN